MILFFICFRYFFLYKNNKRQIVMVFVVVDMMVVFSATSRCHIFFLDFCVQTVFYTHMHEFYVQETRDKKIRDKNFINRKKIIP